MSIDESKQFMRAIVRSDVLDTSKQLTLPKGVSTDLFLIHYKRLCNHVMDRVEHFISIGEGDKCKDTIVAFDEKRLKLYIGEEDRVFIPQV